MFDMEMIYQLYLLCSKKDGKILPMKTSANCTYFASNLEKKICFFF